MEHYIEIADGSVSNRNYIIPTSNLTKYLKPQKELYRSYYCYDTDIIEHLKIQKTVSSFKGKYYLDAIVIDIDKSRSSDLEVLVRARLFVQRLEDEWKLDRNQIEIYYSGSGYHLQFPDIFGFESSEYLPDEVKQTFQAYFPEMDTMPLMKTGLIRVPLSFNIKTNRYKVRLRTEEFFGLKPEDIIEIAQSPREVVILDDNEYDTPNYKHMIIKAEAPRHTALVREEPTRIVTCTQKMFNEGAISGTRHVNMLRMVGSWRLAGLPINAIKVLIRYWANGTMSEYEIEKQVNYLWDKGYTPGCEDTVRLKYCDPKCVFYVNRNYIAQIADVGIMEKKFKDFIRKDFSTSSFDLNEFFTLKDEYRVYPGELVIVLGETKLGKSLLVQNIMVKLKRMKILYLTLEVSQNLMFRRFIQIAHSMTKNQVIEHYKTNENGLTKEIEHIQVMETAPELDSIKRLIAQLQPKLVIVDTIDGINVKHSFDGVDKTEKLAVALKQLAQSLGVIIIGVHHISKHAAIDEKGRPKELTVHAGKGSSSIEQKADRIIGIQGVLSDRRRLVKSLATRDDTNFEIQCDFDPETFQVKQII